MATYEWNSPKQAARYTKAVNRKRLIKDAMHLLDPDHSENESVPPKGAVASSGTARGKKP